MDDNANANAASTHVLSVLDTEKVNPATSEIDRMSPLEIVRVINAEDEKVALAVRQVLPDIALAIERIAARLRIGGRLIYVGAGTSGRLGALDASECPPTFNIPQEMVVASIAGGAQALGQAHEDLEDSAEAGSADVARLGISEKDVVIGITASGRTPYALGAIAYAKERRALTIGLACNAHTPLEQEVEIMIAPLVGPEVDGRCAGDKLQIATTRPVNLTASYRAGRGGRDEAIRGIRRQSQDGNSGSTGQYFP